jgi:AraC-like DNA-binding protein
MAPNRKKSWISSKASSGDIEWASAYFSDLAFSPHRHDTYAIGITTTGVQSFNYRGSGRNACVGDVFILHPDELHDGRQGTEEGYGYRIVYLAPNLISEALDGHALPFVADVVTRDARMKQAITNAFPDFNEIEDELYRADAITVLADTMNRLAGDARTTKTHLDFTKIIRVRDYLLEKAPTFVGMATLEHEHGIDRYSLSRQFRMAFGVSPYRFVTLRRLDIAKSRIQQGQSLAEAAIATGFADQSHLTRQFRKAFGLSPGTWRKLLV